MPPIGVVHRSEGAAGIRNPSGGGVHDFQLFDPGSADRGERRLNGAFSLIIRFRGKSGPGESPRPDFRAGASFVWGHASRSKQYFLIHVDVGTGTSDVGGPVSSLQNLEMA